MVLQTTQLVLREMTEADLPTLCAILQDPEVMYAYAHAFSDAEVQEWLAKQQKRYREDGFGLWAVVCKENGQMIGQCGLTWQNWKGGQVLEIGYLFAKEHWHQGYATEAAIACRHYAFETLGAQEVFSIIRTNNITSRRVAKRNGMTLRGHFTKYDYQQEMPHDVFSVRRKQAAVL